MTSRRDVREILHGGAQLAGAVLTAPVLRWWYGHWGATPAEVTAVMPGDEFVPAPKLTSTRAVTISASPDQVWAWLVQIGQGRGGFYSYDSLENLLSCDINSSCRIEPDWQELRAGDLVRLAPAEAKAPCYRVAIVEPPGVLVLTGADPRTRASLPVPASADELAITWQWMLRPGEGGTRLVARQRFSYPRFLSVLWHLVEPVDFVMERQMLLTIKARAEGRARPEPR